MVSDREEETVSPARRAPLRVVLAALVAACLSALTIAPAHAAAYRYWGFYQLSDGAWTFAQKGPDQTVPKDGSVDGWRFAVADEASTRYPRAVLTFDELCGTTPAQTGKKRVGLVVDFGRPADAADGATPPEPKALCAVVAADATSAVVLAAAGDVRTEKGLVCGVDGYPTTDCGGAVKEVSPEAKAADEPVTIAAPAATPSASASAPAASSTDVAVATTASSGANVTAYVIAGLVLLALVGYLLVRSRSRARQDA
ncbi:hypothetical protein ASG96_09745 [Terrabacter sp. Soil810]|nr:hypothetical protein ASD90_14860 [Terrabacter sp. Root181]KRF41058.1 hypothetical protein ASG96_09745 [Terrabacter sp. Soil810]